jgi:hypothetical protein
MRDHARIPLTGEAPFTADATRAVESSWHLFAATHVRHAG